MIETRRRHLTVVKSSGRTVARDAITLPPPMPMSQAPRIAECTLLLYCPEQGGWQGSGCTRNSAGYRQPQSITFGGDDVDGGSGRTDRLTLFLGSTSMTAPFCGARFPVQG
jgi:hypothetical protein